MTDWGKENDDMVVMRLLVAAFDHYCSDSAAARDDDETRLNCGEVGIYHPTCLQWR